jgi:glutathione S-transferase
MAMATLQIIGLPLSTYTRVVRMTAHEKGIAYDFIEARPHTPEVKAIHPAGKIPVMRHGDVTMFESRAIAHYIDDHFPGPALTPRTPAGDSLVEQWISYINTVTDPLLIRRYLFAYIFPKTADKKPDRAAIDEMMPAVAREIEVLDGAVAANGYLADKQFTLADIYLLPILAYVRNLPEGGKLIGETMHLKNYFGRHSERESFKLTAPPPPPGKA